jgi:hypothetical protein
VFVYEIRSICAEKKKNTNLNFDFKRTTKKISNFIRMDAKFPEEVRIKLAELDLELSEGKIKFIERYY